jgi:hypothetical protein
VTSIVKAATKRIEALIDQKLINQTWAIYYDQWPTKFGGYQDEWWDGVRDGAISMLTSQCKILNLPIGPLSSLTGIYSYDEDDTEYIFSNSNYTVDATGPYARIGLKIGATWPTTILRPVNGIKIQGVFGFGAADTNVPDDIKEAIKQLSAVMYEHRGDELPKIPAAVSMLLEPYRRFKI